MSSDLLGRAAELAAAGSSMQEAEFYDAAMTGDGEPAMLPVEASPWRPVYDEAARWVPSSADVMDLGCGTGRFLALLSRTSHRGLLHGVDFSPAAVAEARRYLKVELDDEATYYHRVRIDVADLRDYEAPDGYVFTCLEVLEHLKDDLGLLSSLPAGSRLIFSVPSYMSASHVRCFPRLSQVFARFEPYLDINRWTKYSFDNNTIHICDSIRRDTSW